MADAHTHFLEFIESLETMRKNKTLTPDVCVGQTGTLNITEAETSSRTSSPEETTATSSISSPASVTICAGAGTSSPSSNGASVCRGTARGPLGMF